MNGLWQWLWLLVKAVDKFYSAAAFRYQPQRLTGRWNSPARPAIYGALSYACSMLEILVHANIGRIPRTHGYVVADVPKNLPVERHVSMSLPPAWDGDSPSIARRFGDHWLNEHRSLVLVVPSVAAKLEGTAVVNPQHPSAVALLVSQSQIVIWDQRLFDCK